MAQIISVINQKGGVGKSAIAVNLSYELSLAGKKTLLIDLDPQGNSSYIYSNITSTKETISEIFSNTNTKINTLIKEAKIDGEEIIKNLYIIPSNLKLSVICESLYSRLYKEKILYKHINEIKNNYDFIILDCPPNLGLLSINALFASEIFLIVVNYGRQALEGMGDLLQCINEVKNEEQYKFYIARNGFAKKNANSVKFIHKQLEGFKDFLLTTLVRQSEAVNQAFMNGVPVRYFDSSSNGAKDFCKLAEELLINVS